MGNFTQDAFFRRVTPKVRREMAEWARKALLKLGVAPADIPWPAWDDAPSGKPDLVVVAAALIRRFEALGRELHAACVAAARAERPTNAAAIALRARAATDFYYDYEHVAQDLFNTIAGDLAWEHKSDSKRLGAATEALKNPIGILKNEFHALADHPDRGDAAHFEASVELLAVGLQRLAGLAERVEAAARPR